MCVYTTMFETHSLQSADEHLDVYLNYITLDNCSSNKLSEKQDPDSVLSFRGLQSLLRKKSLCFIIFILHCCSWIKNLPGVSLVADWVFGFVGKVLGLQDVELVTGSQS